MASPSGNETVKPFGSFNDWLSTLSAESWDNRPWRGQTLVRIPRLQEHQFSEYQDLDLPSPLTPSRLQVKPRSFPPPTHSPLSPSICKPDRIYPMEKFTSSLSIYESLGPTRHFWKTLWPRFSAVQVDLWSSPERFVRPTFMSFFLTFLWLRIHKDGFHTVESA